MPNPSDLPCAEPNCTMPMGEHEYAQHEYLVMCPHCDKAQPVIHLYWIILLEFSGVPSEIAAFERAHPDIAGFG